MLPLFFSLLFSTVHAQEKTQYKIDVPKAQTEPARPSAVQLGLNLKSDTVRNLDGGLEKRTVFLGTLNLSAAFDFERMSLSKGTTMRLEALGSYGSAPSRSVGDIQFTSNIEATPAIRLYQAWIQQNFASDRVSLLAGLNDLNGDFYLTEASAVLLNSSFALGPELSHTGRNGISVFPSTALGFRGRVQPTDALKIQAAVFDGVPGDPVDPDHTHIILSPEEGILGITEVDYAYSLGGQPGSFGVGAWFFSSRTDDLSETDDDGKALRARAKGVYLVANQKIYSPRQGQAPGLSTFTRMGYATPDVNPISLSVATGFSYIGLVPRRLEDQIAIGLALAQTSQHAEWAAMARDYKVLALSEMALELTYRAKLAKWAALQPDFQWIINPSMNTAIARAIVAGARLELTL